jgi:hypothetical protein
MTKFGVPWYLEVKSILPVSTLAVEYSMPLHSEAVEVLGEEDIFARQELLALSRQHGTKIKVHLDTCLSWTGGFSLLHLEHRLTTD